MTPKAFHTLEALVRRSGRLVEKDELLREIWPDSFVEEANLSMNVSAVRRVLGEEAGAHQYIETVPKRGYRFVAAVRVLPGESAGSNGSGGRIAPEPELPITGVRGGEPPPVPSTAPEATAAAGSRVWRVVGAIAGLVALVALTVAITLAVSGTFVVPQPAFDLQRMRIAKVAGTAKVDRAVVSPDGKYLAQIVMDGGRSSLSIRQMATTRTVEIIPPADVYYDGVTFSPDGTSIYYVTARPEGATAHRIPALGGRSIKIADDVDRAVGVAPDGLRIAFVRVDYDLPETSLVVSSLDGSESRALVTRPEGETQLAGNAVWSPDGRRIACVDFESTTPNLQGLVEVSAEDGSTRAIGARQWKIVERICWLPDGSGLLISALPAGSMGQPFQIWHVAYPSGEVRRVTNDLSSYLEVSVTADGSTLVATQSSSLSRIDVIALAEPDTVTRRLVPGSSALDGVQGLDWGPNGRIFYMTWGSGNTDIWSMNEDGTGAVQLTDDAYREWWPDVSPDGRSVVYASNHGTGTTIWKVEVEGGPPVQLTSGAADGHPMCSRDGWVYFVRRRDGPSLSLFKVPLGGGEAVEVFSGPLNYPMLSADGTTIADLGPDSPNGHNIIRIVSTADGREIRRFDAGAVYLWNGVRWAEDGSGLVYVAARDGVTNVWLQSTRGGAPRQLTNFTSDNTVNAALSPDGRSLACTRVSASTIVVTITDFR